MVGMRDDAETAAEAIRSINHSLAAQPAVPAPEVYRLLGGLKWTAH
ncbi:hypothetical protein ONR57_22580 [Hoyosella sp. YIM 151337]|nr:hypothetical protein [Hoyosella sp. YIM 151337]MCW4356095.1 hypothetical protein [Hoyosella sp. YIM 151337]